MQDPTATNVGRVSYQRSPGCLFRWFRGQVLVLSPDGSRIRITGSGAVAWMALSTVADLRTLAHRIAETWPDLGPTGETDVTDALRPLVDAGLVTAGQLETELVDPGSEGGSACSPPRRHAWAPGS